MKKNLKSLCCLTIFWLLAARLIGQIYPPCVHPDSSLFDSLLAYYTFEGNVNDMTGNGLHGTSFGTTRTYEAGVLGDAVRYKNENPTNNVHYVNDYDSLPPISINSVDGFSIAFWAKFISNTAPTPHSANFYSLTNCADAETLVLAIFNGKVLLWLTGNTIGPEVGDVLENVWQHHVLSIQNNMARYYIDGEESWSQSLNAFDFNNVNQYLAYHCWFNGNGKSSRYNGALDELRIYKRGLTANEASMLAGVYGQALNLSICEGETAQLTSTIENATSYAWMNLSNGTLVGNNVNISPTVFDTVTFQITTTNNGCNYSEIIHLDPGEVVVPSNLGADTTICAGQFVFLDASSPICLNCNYSWSDGGATSSQTVSPVAAVTYTVTVTSADGCESSASKTITTTPLPIANAAANQPCPGDDIQLFETGGDGVGWAWSGPSGLFTAQNPTVPNASLANAGSYSVTVTDAIGCTATSQALVVLQGLPTVTASNDGPKCEGSSVLLSALDVGGTNWSWTGPNGFSASVDAPELLDVSVLQSGVYIVVVTNAAGCIATSSTVVDVNPLPVTTIGIQEASGLSPNDGFVCAGATVSLTATGGSSFAWSSGQATPTIIANPITTSSFTVTVTDANSCSAMATTGLVVNPIPVAEAGDDVAICEPIQLAGNSSNSGVSYNWSSLDGNIVSGANTATPTVSEGGTYVLTVFDGATGCTASDELLVAMAPELAPSYLLDSIVCEGENGGAITIANILFGTPPYQFTLNGQDYGMQQVFDGLPTGIYDLNIMDAKGCEGSLSFAVTTPLYSLDLGPDRTLVEWDTILLDAGAGADSYQWFSEDNSTLSCDDCPAPIARPTRPEGIGENSPYPFVYVVMAAKDGCAFFDTIRLFVFPKIAVPPVITPNGDGINDEFKIPELENNAYPNNEVTIFNRWGEVVFRKQPYDNVANVFRGKDMAGRDLPEGTYYYVINLSLADRLIRRDRVAIVRYKQQ
ncbi:MAG: gliding motility-associated C-terminal domain-containing protein [Saprospiraceae bacterium]|nr:gliding motility-associated C-terminal domain-containing protein [Saprospiraceae bacterium]MCF8251229.1 gliding motility-associated C-terminal domain-containing protein [Saprospiraceae bacterium]MCF8281213.1 gliding motility-associated C-terminal domain-containing protein [Bacteroidales bacterium]MCF8313147.1 gliding motility-associated C-terminal domain-containing protein [Saprospiraceae bacterium]MCF8441591.1 gliding motility-associated C-terminal domain-containing protein [Saprospiraceae 